MREILFRGKRESDGKWVYGEYITIYNNPKYKAIKTCIELNTGIYKVDPDTVCQFTGLTDKDDKKIFENDIVTSDDFCPGNEGYGVINWRNDDLMFVVDTDGFYCDFSNFDWTKLEIIGNTFDNPELIGGVEE